MKKGILYIASGSKHIEDAIKSVKSVKENTGLPVTLIADREIKNPHFDTVLQSEDFLYHYGDSVLRIPTLPYENTLLLDTDTIVSDDIDELFSLTDKYDIAASTIAESKFEIDDKVPSVLPEFNTGVILFNRNGKTSDFIDKWKSIYKGYLERNIRMNQPAFREAIYQSSARVITISTEYNCRANFGGYLTEKVKIIHGSFDNPEQILRDLNESIVPRVFFNKNGCLTVKEVNTTNNRFDWDDQ